MPHAVLEQERGQTGDTGQAAHADGQHIGDRGLASEQQEQQAQQCQVRQQLQPGPGCQGGKKQQSSRPGFARPQREREKKSGDQQHSQAVVAAAAVGIGHAVAAEDQERKDEPRHRGPHQAQPVQGQQADGGDGQDEHVVQPANRDHVKPEDPDPRVEAERVERAVAGEQRVAALKPGRSGEALAKVEVSGRVGEHDLVLPDHRAPRRCTQVGGQEYREQHGAENQLHPAGVQQTVHQPAPWVHPVERCKRPRSIPACLPCRGHGFGLV